MDQIVDGDGGVDRFRSADRLEAQMFWPMADGLAPLWPGRAIDKTYPSTPSPPEPRLG